MSNSIWHKPSETTDVDNNLIIDDWTNRTYELGYFDDNDMIFRNFRNDDTYFEESMMRWCDVNELIDDYDRTRKDLEIARKALEYYADSRFGKKQDDGTYVLEIEKGYGVTVVWTYDPRPAKQALEHIKHKE